MTVNLEVVQKNVLRLKPKHWVRPHTPYNSIRGFESIVNEVHKLNKVQKFSECKLTICCSTEDIKGDQFRTNKCKVRMIFSESSFAQTSNLGERLSQIRQARQTSFTTMDSPTKPSVFSLSSFASSTLCSVMSVSERSQYNLKKP